MSLLKTCLPALGLLSICAQLFLFPEAAHSVRGLMICNVEGTAELRPNGNSAAAVTAERNSFLVNEADTLITDSNGSVRVGIDEFLGRVDVLADTSLGIADMARDVSSNATRLALNEGSVHVSFYRSHVDPDSVFIIQTPTAILTVIGNFLPPDMPLTTQDNRPIQLSYNTKGDNRAAFCSDPVDLFEIENFDAWEPAMTVAFNTDTVSAGQTLNSINDSKNIPNFLVTVDSDGTTQVQVDSGMVFIEKRPAGGTVADVSYSDESIYERILAALSHGTFDDSVGMVAGPGVQVIVSP